MERDQRFEEAPARLVELQFKAVPAYVSTPAHLQPPAVQILLLKTTPVKLVGNDNQILGHESQNSYLETVL